MKTEKSKRTIAKQKAYNILNSIKMQGTIEEIRSILLDIDPSLASEVSITNDHKKHSEVTDDVYWLLRKLRTVGGALYNHDTKIYTLTGCLFNLKKPLLFTSRLRRYLEEKKFQTKLTNYSVIH